MVSTRRAAAVEARALASRQLATLGVVKEIMNRMNMHTQQADHSKVGKRIRLKEIHRCPDKGDREWLDPMWTHMWQHNAAERASREAARAEWVLLKGAVAEKVAPAFVRR